MINYMLLDVFSVWIEIRIVEYGFHLMNLVVNGGWSRHNYKSHDPDLTIILNDYIVDQEVENVPYVMENGCGKFSKSPKEIAEIVGQWFGPKAHEHKTMIVIDLN
uniref:Uncharacterized protein n=1 Tax=Lactuca sativa TaxID=4236 RepID=A0A9R1XPF8_LACSA|nr:hypothetical protein LSAT_V11C400222690 [Lactuca sativa]